MPAANDSELCFNHASRLRRMRVKPCPPSTWVTVPLISFVFADDENSVLENINATARAFDHQQIDYRQLHAVTNLMHLALKTVREGKKLEKTVTSKEMVRHFRVDNEGNAFAIPDPAEAEQNPASAQAAPVPEPGSILVTLNAVAEDETTHKQTVDADLPATPLKRTVTTSGKITPIVSNTYLLNGRKIHRAQLHRAKPDQVSQILGIDPNLAR